MNPLQQLVSLGLLKIREVPVERRPILLEKAATILDGEIANVCKAEALCLRNAEKNQTTLEQILKEAVQ
jgi:hypothetical protein